MTTFRNKSLNNGLYSLKNSHNPFGKGFQPAKFLQELFPQKVKPVQEVVQPEIWINVCFSWETIDCYDRRNMKCSGKEIQKWMLTFCFRIYYILHFFSVTSWRAAFKVIWSCANLLSKKLSDLSNKISLSGVSKKE